MHRNFVGVDALFDATAIDAKFDVEKSPKIPMFLRDPYFLFTTPKNISSRSEYKDRS